MVRPIRPASLLLALIVAGFWLASTTEAKEPHLVVQLAKKLAEPVDFPGLDDPKTTLRDALDFLAQKYGVRFDINERAFQNEQGGLAGTAKAPRLGGSDLALVVADDKPAQPGKTGPADKPKPPVKPPSPPPAANAAPDVSNSEIALKPIPKMTHVRLSTVLKKILERVPSASGATYVLRRDGIEITTEAAKTAEFKNPADHAPPGPEVDPLSIPSLPILLVQAEFDKRPLDEALKELADATDTTVVLDVRATDKAKAVTATLINVPMDTAVDLLANMSGLQVVSRDRVLYVTTKDNAEAMQKEQKERVKPAVNPVPAPPGIPQPLPPGLGIPSRP